MSERRSGLGKGLGALIPAAQTPGGTGDAPSGHPGLDPASAAAATPTKTKRRPVDVFFESAAQPTTAGAAEGQSAGAIQGHPGLDPESETPTPEPDLVEVPGASFAFLPVDAIVPNPRQPREVFDEDALAELAASIKEVGLLQPVVVRPAPDGQAGYELVMGERRWRATQVAGLGEIPAIIRQTQDQDLLRDALLENLHRANLNPLEEAAAYRQMLDDFGCTQDELASRIARSRPHIANTLRLLKLPPLVQRRLAAGVLSAGHARALLGLNDAAAMERLAQRIVAEGLSVRSTEEIVAVGDVPVGTASKGKPAKARPGARRDALDALQERLTDRFDTRVTVNLGQRKGKITIEFASVQDLNRILELLAPDDPGLFK
ncbi:MAG: ParB/RepB/Spo0J family partition protein [Bifidobacteriaceae bacterium]|jgi:ParB family chromosome partitioning protein|nr:ParB/RepB/Spo0J family partition protein [Bifidobacteriaceae bacterium]